MTLMEYLNSKRFVNSLMIVILTLFLLYIIKQFLIKKVAYTTKAEQHQNTFIGILFNLLQYIVVIVAIVFILQLHGINVTSILAGLGIFATIVGLALQDTLKDIFAGMDIYNNNFYKVGDLVRYNGEECDVKYFSARITKLKSITTNSTYTVKNSLMNSVEKIKDLKTILIFFKFDTDKALVEKSFNKVIERIKKEGYKDLKEIDYIGIVTINDKGVGYVLTYKAPAHKYLPIQSRLYDLCYEEFKKNKITPVFNRDYLK